MLSLNLISENIIYTMFVIVITECKEDKIEDSETRGRPSAICETARI